MTVQRARYLHDDEHDVVEGKGTALHACHAVARVHLGKERIPGSLSVGAKKLSGVMGGSNVLVPADGY